MEITKENLNAFRADASAALEAVAQKYGIKITVGKIAYSTNTFDATLKCENLGEEVTKEKNQNLKYFGANFNIGFKFMDRGVEYEVVDVKTNSRVNPIVLKDDRGRQYTCRVSFVNQFVKQ